MWCNWCHFKVIHTTQASGTRKMVRRILVLKKKIIMAWTLGCVVRTRSREFLSWPQYFQECELVCGEAVRGHSRWREASDKSSRINTREERIIRWRVIDTKVTKNKTFCSRVSRKCVFYCDVKVGNAGISIVMRAGMTVCKESTSKRCVLNQTKSPFGDSR